MAKISYQLGFLWSLLVKTSLYLTKMQEPSRKAEVHVIQFRKTQCLITIIFHLEKV
jgi:hypothetical protein